MNGKGNDIEKVFRDVFQHAELEPPAAVWEKISAEINPTTPPVVIVLWKKIAAVAASLVFVAFCIYFLLKPEQATIRSETQQNTQKNTDVVNSESENSILTPQQQEQSLKEAELLSEQKALLESSKLSISAFPPSDEPLPQLRLSPAEYMQAISSYKEGKGFINGSAIEESPKTTAKELQLLQGVNPVLLPLVLTRVELTPVYIYDNLQSPVSEEQTSDKSATKRWQVDVVYTVNQSQLNFGRVNRQMPSPLVSGQFYDSTSVANSLTDSVKMLNSSSIGIQLSYQVHKHWRVGTGLWHTRSAYQMENTLRLFVPDVLFGRFVDVPNSVNIEVHHLHIPVQVSYTSAREKLNYHLSAGASADLLSHYTLKSDVQNITYNLGTYKSNVISGLAGAGVSYTLHPSVLLRLDATYRRALTSAYDSPNLQATPHWIHLGGGISFRF